MRQQEIVSAIVRVSVRFGVDQELAQALVQEGLELLWRVDRHRCVVDPLALDLRGYHKVTEYGRPGGFTIRESDLLDQDLAGRLDGLLIIEEFVGDLGSIFMASLCFP